MKWCDCNFQDIFSEIIPHSGNVLLIMEEILIAVWGNYAIGKQIVFPLQSCSHLHLLSISVIFHFWEESVNNGPVALRNPQKCITTSKLNLSHKPSVPVYFGKTSLTKNYSPVLMVIQFECILL